MFSAPPQARAVAGASAGPVSPSADHTAALVETQRMAAFTGRVPGSADLLLGLMRVGGAAARLLYERGITHARLESHLGEVRPEPATAVRQLDAASQQIARHLAATQTTSLHLLLAILRNGGAGMDLLRLSGHEPARIRSLVMRALTGPGRLSERSVHRGPAPVPAFAPAPAAADERSPTPAPLVEASRAGARDGGRGPARGSTGRPAARDTLPMATSRREPRPAVKNDIALELVELAIPTRKVLHREREIGRLLDLLCVGAGRVTCVVGEPGSGRSAVVAALAQALDDKPMAPSAGPSPATGGTPGSWLSALHDAAPPDVPLVLDGCSGLGGENSDGPAQLLATARAGRRWIVLCTPADLRRFELWSPELAANLEVVPLSPLDGERLDQVVEQGLEALADAHGVALGPELARVLVRLSPRYPTDRAQPGRSLAIAEIAAARATRLELPRVSQTEVAAVVADASSVPVEQLLRTDDDRFRTLETRLAERVIGHDEARARIASVIRRSYAGFRGRRPLASVLLLGPTGVGKTETARAIAESLFDSERSLVRIDLSEFNEPHTVARLVGSPPGYVGHEDGGQLTEAVRRRPACVVLLDEMEKAHREVLLVLLQILEDGRLTDGRGRTVDFSSTTVVMTSNLGSELYKRSKSPPQTSVLALARSRMPPELWNRIDEVLCYRPLGDPELRRIVGKLAEDSSRRLGHERDIRFRIDDAVIARVLDEELDRSLGARPLRRAFERLVEAPIANEILNGAIRPGSELSITCSRNGEVVISSL